MKKIALITTYFPPIKSIASNRMEAFATYLSEDFEVHVFCTEGFTSNPKITVHSHANKSLIDKIKSNADDSPFVHKVKTALKVLLKKITVSPLQKWAKSCSESLNLAHEHKAFDCIISSFAPHEPHLVAINFIKKHPEVKWIADMRDEMSLNPGNSKSYQTFLKIIEKDINQYATAVSSVSYPIVDAFKELMPNIKHFKEIRNGFNHQLKFPLQKSQAPYKIGYFGNFYGDRKPNYLFNILKKHIDFEVHIYGAVQNFDIPKDHNFDSRVYLHPGLPYEDAILKMHEMDLNFVVHPASSRKGVYTGKLFDYISAKRPVLALVDQYDVAADLIKSFQCGYVAHYNDSTEIQNAINSFLSDQKENISRVATDDQIQTLHRSNEINKLKQLIHEII